MGITGLGTLEGAWLSNKEIKKHLPNPQIQLLRKSAWLKVHGPISRALCYMLHVILNISPYRRIHSSNNVKYVLHKTACWVSSLG